MQGKQQGLLSFLMPARVWADEHLLAFFPHRQILFRSEGNVRCLNLSSGLQGAVAGVMLMVISWVGFASGSVFLHELQLAAKDTQVANVRVAYRSLLGEVADYQKRFSTVVRNLEENHAMMLSLVGKNTAIQANLNELEVSRSVRALEASDRANMVGQLDDVERQMQSLSQSNFSLKGDMVSIETDLQDALTERNTALLQSTQMRRDIKLLENQLVNLEDKENDTVERLTGQAETFIHNMEQLIELAGMDVEDLMAGDTDLLAGQGGPFIALQADGRPGGRLKFKLQNLENRLSYSDDLQTVIKKLPFAVPLHGFYLTSTFGKRRDPVNGRLSMHYGLDYGSSPRAAVYVTAPGKVTMAGWNGNYGKMIEVDHGAGIRTRYAHLSKTVVKKGQIVKFGEKIGVIGSTGRSTGNHLHYEVLFRDKGINPMKLIKAGRYVFQK